MHKIITIAITMGLATTALADEVTTDVFASSVIVPGGRGHTDVGAALVTLSNADIVPQGNGLVVMYFDTHVARDAAGGVLSRGGASKAIASQDAAGGIDTILIAPEGDPNASECTLDLDFYDWCLTNIVADPGVSCGEPDCQDLFDFCEDESWFGDC